MVVLNDDFCFFSIKFYELTAIFMKKSLTFHHHFEVTQAVKKMPAKRCFKGKTPLRFHIGSPEVSQPKKEAKGDDQNLGKLSFSGEVMLNFGFFTQASHIKYNC